MTQPGQVLAASTMSRAHLLALYTEACLQKICLQILINFNEHEEDFLAVFINLKLPLQRSSRVNKSLEIFYVCFQKDTEQCC